MIRKKTAIKYAKALKEYCESRPYCDGCPFESFSRYVDCKVADLRPCEWKIPKEGDGK